MGRRTGSAESRHLDPGDPALAQPVERQLRTGVREQRQSTPSGACRRRRPGLRPGVRHRRSTTRWRSAAGPAASSGAQRGPARGTAVIVASYSPPRGGHDPVEPVRLLGRHVAPFDARHPVVDDAQPDRASRSDRSRIGPGCPRPRAPPAAPAGGARPLPGPPPRRSAEALRVSPAASTRIQSTAVLPTWTVVRVAGLELEHLADTGRSPTRTRWTDEPCWPAVIVTAWQRARLVEVDLPPLVLGARPDSHSVSSSPSTAAYGRSPGRAPPPAALASDMRRRRRQRPAPTSRAVVASGHRRAAGSPWSGCRTGATSPGVMTEEVAVVDPAEEALAVEHAVGQDHRALRGRRRGRCRRQAASARSEPARRRPGRAGPRDRRRPSAATSAVTRVVGAVDLEDLDGGVLALPAAVDQRPGHAGVRRAARRRRPDRRSRPAPVRASRQAPGAPAPGRGRRSTRCRSLRTTR